jgi:alpha-mannosidase
MIKRSVSKRIACLYILIGLCSFSIKAQENKPLMVSNETFEVLKKVSMSSLADGEILLSLTTHQDLGWIDEIEKCVVMRDTQWITPFMDRLDTDPSFEMDIEQASIIQEYIIRHPEKKQEISKRLQEGRMLIGSTYTQPYEEMYYSESLARQFYLGKLWLKKEFDGYNATSYYNSDVPGRAMQMPQLMAKAGVNNMFISRHERGVFDWYGPDGSKVTTYSPGHYIDFYNILGKANEEALKELAGQALIWSDGYNDIPGELTVMPAVLNFEFIWDPKPVENLDSFTQFWNTLEEVENENGERLQVRLPEIRFSTLDKFFTQITKSTNQLPSITGERPNVWIYIHGPSHHWALDHSRQADILLPAAEKFATADAVLLGSFSKYPLDLFNQAWESKIYPDHGWGGKGGVSTDHIFLMRYADAHTKALMLMENSIQSLAGKVNTSPEKGIPVVVFNSLNWDRSSPVKVQMSFDPGTAKSISLYDKTGKELSVQLDKISRNEAGYLNSAELTFVASDVPSMGYDTYYIVPSDKEFNQNKRALSSEFENGFYQAKLADGGLASLFDKELGVELVEDSFFKAGEIFTMKSEGNGAGEFDAVQQPEMVGFDKTGNYETSWDITADGPVYTSYKYRQPIAHAVAELEITFYHQIKKVDFDVKLMNWDGTMFREFRMAMPLQIKDGEVAYEAPFGVVEVGKDEMEGAAGERYTVPCKDLHPRGIENWISASGDKFGLTLSSSVVAMDYIDPTNKGLKNTILQPVLLASRRSCHWEGNDYHQTGNHSFSFSITSHEPGWHNGLKQGREANELLQAIVDPPKFTSAELDESMSFLQLEAENVVVSAMKKAENENGVVIRLYNLNEEETEVTLRFTEKFQKAWRTNLIEEPEDELELKDGVISLKVGNQAIETILLME